MELSGLNTVIFTGDGSPFPGLPHPQDVRSRSKTRHILYLVTLQFQTPASLISRETKVLEQ
jgi:hypothetical protein